MLEFSQKLVVKQIRDVEQEETSEGLLLKGVPVFSAGEYDGKKRDEKFIDDKIIKHFDPEEDIPIQANHSGSTFDTLGYVKKLYRDGKTLFSDLLLIDDNAIARWKKKLMKKFSISIYPSGYGEPEGKLREISFVPFPRVKNAAVHSESEDKIEVSKNDWEEYVKWSQKEKNSLPDSCFLLIKSEVKDKSSDRAVLVKNKSGEYDESHVRNAMARINQVEGFSADEVDGAKRKLKAIAKRLGIKVSSDFNEVPDIEWEVVENMEDIKKILEEFSEKEKKWESEKATMKSEHDTVVKAKTDLEAQIKEKDSKITELSDTVSKYKTAEKEAKISAKVEEYRKAGKVIPAQVDTIKAHMLKLSDEEYTSFCEVLDKSTPAVKFDESGHQVSDKETGKTDVDDKSVNEILALAEKKSKDENRDFWEVYNELFAEKSE